MADCEHFEIAIEQRRAGALDEQGTRALDDHLAACASCRAFEQLVRETDASLRGEIAMSTQTVQWNDLRATMLSTARRGARQRLGLGVVVLAVMTPLVAIAAGEKATVTAVAVGLAVLLVKAVRTRDAIGDLKEAPEGAFFFMYARALRRMLRSLWIWSAVALVLFLWAAYAQLRGDWSAHDLIVLVPAAILALSALAYRHLVTRPRIERELADVDSHR